MKLKLNFKKILLTIGLTLIIPGLLNVVACDTVSSADNDWNVIKKINNVKDLTIDISENETDRTVFQILNHDELGLATKISKHHDQEIVKNFKKDLFSLDSEKVFFDKNGEDQVTKDTKIETRSYYFHFKYNNKENNAFVPIKITNTEQDIVSAIDITSYKLGFWAGDSVEELKYMIDDNFIKSQLDDTIKQKYKPIFILNKITVAGQEITEKDLAMPGVRVNAKINYNYGSCTNKITELEITIKKIPEITPERFKEIAQERGTNSPMIFTIETFKGTGDYLPAVLNKMTQQIEEELLNIYKLKLDPTKIKMEKITSIQMNPKTIDTQWFIAVNKFTAIGSCTYDGLSTGGVRIVFNVVDSITDY